MKHRILSILVLATVVIIVFSCKQAPDKSNEKQEEKAPALHGQETGEAGNSTTAPQNFSIETIVKDYLTLKTALTIDDGKAAAEAGKQLFGSLNAVDMKTIPGDKLRDYTEIADNAKENAEHISVSAEKIAHQREHFASLSKDVADLIELFGTKQKLYEDHCPMFNDGKGAIWISETKEIKNPYYGSKMITCGSVKKEY
ncbi:hypothetical protein ASG38_08870 [Flavobacterium sp. Leaf359]|uniref:DUF3347 domain-containing protein n=1 Tax=Flavobacterium sp. Leaf359 TaxID=1736351 RepID=UPI0006FE57F6|nr:DUF3347 domain-containing protein [Flavobacterium sp. Leaf359]KQS47546.1 hypothetical protein ASG38_08870 [Flavobacterium sp. Leaf359]